MDGYFFLPQEGFVKLINLLGGVDVELESAMKLGETSYGKGVKTLDGAGALEYVLKRDKGVSGDVARLVRQRKVFLALFQRLCAQSEKQLNDTSLIPLMSGSTPIRSNMTAADMVSLVKELKKVKPEKMTAQIIPGEITAFNANSYYSVHRASLAKVLNADFHPYDNEVTEADLQVTELATGGTENTHRQVLADVAVTQTGFVEASSTSTTAQSTATTTKKAG